MRFVLLIYDVDYEEEVMEALGRAGLGSFTLWERVLGKGTRSEPKLGSHAWPSVNRAMLLVVPEGGWEEARRWIADLAKRPGIRAFFWEGEEVKG